MTTQHFNNLPPVDRARISARSASEQSTDTAVRAEVIMLRDENADLRFKLARSIEQLEDERAELADMRRKFEASQLLADQAIRERDEWHRRANDLNRAIGAVGAEHLRNRGALIRENVDLRDEIAALRTHDGIVLDKAIRPREVTG